MTSLHERSVLIVDRSNGAGVDIRRAFLKAGAAAHVVSSFAAAGNLLENKRIDAVLLDFGIDVETVAFCQTLSDLSVPYFFIGESPPESLPCTEGRQNFVATIRSVAAEDIGTSA